MTIHRKMYGLPLALAVAAVSAFVTPGPMSADPYYQIARARHGSLVLTLKVHQLPSSVDAIAILSNRGPAVFRYFAGCAPPIVQIQARGAAGQWVFGWRKPRIQCFAISPRSVSPGSSIRTHAHFTMEGTISVFAQVPRALKGKKLFVTSPITLTPPS